MRPRLWNHALGRVEYSNEEWLSTVKSRLSRTPLETAPEQELFDAAGLLVTRCTLSFALDKTSRSNHSRVYMIGDMGEGNARREAIKELIRKVAKYEGVSDYVVEREGESEAGSGGVREEGRGAGAESEDRTEVGGGTAGDPHTGTGRTRRRNY